MLGLNFAQFFFFFFSIFSFQFSDKHQISDRVLDGACMLIVEYEKIRINIIITDLRRGGDPQLQQLKVLFDGCYSTA